MTFEPIDIIYLLLELLILNLNVMKGHTEFWGKPLVLYCTVCNNVINNTTCVHSLFALVLYNRRVFIGLCEARRPYWWAHLNIQEFIFARFTQVKLTIIPLPPFKTARALSELFAVQCHQWEHIRNSQLIGIYKEIPVQINWWLSPLPIIPLPPFETARALSQLFTVQCHQWEPIQNSQLIGIDKEGNIPPPPIQNCQRTEWTLCCSMWPMRAHSKQSTNRKI